MYRRVPCVDKLERLVGYRASTSLRTIVDSVAAHQPLLMTADADVSPVEV